MGFRSYLAQPCRQLYIGELLHQNAILFYLLLAAIPALRADPLSAARKTETLDPAVQSSASHFALSLLIPS